MKLRTIWRLKYVAVAAGFAVSGLVSAFDLHSVSWDNSRYALIETTHLMDIKQDNGHSRRLDPLQQASAALNTPSHRV